MIAHVRDIFLAIKQIAVLRWALVLAFMVLTFWELADHTFAVSDVISPFLLVILIHKVFTQGSYLESNSLEGEDANEHPVIIFFRRVKEGAREAFLADSRHLSRSERATKILMNNLFAILFLMAVIGEFVQPGNLHHLQGYAFVAWSAVFLAFNVKDFMRNMSFARLLVTNIALLMVIGSVALL